ncbi:DUF1707 domain-containing protein [Nocardia panacis]|uniref:DUF1707 domain-containing protein n=1 Tax=Nocardia panacis TaxID=2340916 RepID=A0A3A4KCL6_9NOCA|nr:DUF1707 domain-containing protein [Nocardia panacis]RJO79828.1 DUF1707 domain-containing protein [Nocardia panacis]
MTDAPESRIGVTERERALRELVAHLGAGRLSPAEFDTRSAAVAAATTKRQIAELFTDLPAGAPYPPTPRVRPVPRFPIIVGMFAVLSILLAVVSGNALWLLLIIAGPAGAVAIAHYRRDHHQVRGRT